MGERKTMRSPIGPRGFEASSVRRRDAHLTALRRDPHLAELRLDELLVALRAKAVAEFGFGVPREVVFDPLPIISFVPDFFAVGADRHDATDLFNFRQR